MCNPETLLALESFRRELYRSGLGHRKDSLFDLLDAVLTGPGTSTLVRLSLAPVFRRRWPSVPDALADGTLELAAVRRLVGGILPAGGERPLWALDGTIWPRPEAKTSPERTYGHRVTAGRPQSGIVAAWEYQWLLAIPEAQGSWALPLDVRRRGPRADSPTELAIRQLRPALAQRPAGAPRPVVALDSGYDPAQLARAGLEADLVVRLASHRVFLRAPGPYAGRGRPRTHGAAFRLRDPASHGRPDRSAMLEHPEYGRVRVDVWLELHARTAARAPFAVVRVQVERLPRRAKPPAPLWLAWIGGPLPPDLHQLWRWYLRRFSGAEHTCRFAKQALGWTTVRPRHPEAADRWSWLLALALWQLWLARPLVADRRLPWERPLPPARLTPGRVRRAFAGLLLAVGTPARPPQPRGKSPGRRPGQRPGPRTRYPVVRRGPTRAA